jgi:hypothetical protein
MSSVTTIQNHPPTPTAVQNAPQPNAVSVKSKPVQSQPPSSGTIPADTVQISSAAQAALKEATETQAQTAREANGGDHQAQRLLAREAAARSSEA